MMRAIKASLQGHKATTETSAKALKSGSGPHRPAEQRQPSPPLASVDTRREAAGQRGAISGTEALRAARADSGAPREKRHCPRVQSQVKAKPVMVVERVSAPAEALVT